MAEKSSPATSRRPVMILLLLVSLLALVLFNGNREATAGITATGVTLSAPVDSAELAQPGSHPLWSSAEPSVYRWGFALVTSHRCEEREPEDSLPGQHTSLVPDCWLAKFK